MSINSTVTVFPSNLEGAIPAPPSKSLSHRALICAALANGKSRISNLIYSQDILATMSSLETLGAKFEIQDDEVTVYGIKKLKLLHKQVDCNESGSTLNNAVSFVISPTISSFNLYSPDISSNTI